ncbi:uncharacterized protein LOC115073676 isoform X2 [Rhinatrema bivittatum]|uniref:uncharacterized protein LOC115073676 isoform X2 n=1 Tax=Rhinatrema bivittatum TaxID=194408 RepID=UPI00112CB046|nr:uncharacterized protein LOC115073676 isoform X2 [Rhinatrema bivittatum]
MEASLTCAVCLCLFEEPVTLPLCSHNFCKRCLLECASSASPGVDVPLPALGRGYYPRGAEAQQQQLSCPLCRKVSTVAGGACSLPVNTTLAEVVKLIKPGAGGVGEAETPRLKASACPKHTGHSLQLYCKMCRRVACGQCVVEEHQGIFHAINLTDIMYQEEKLMFFSNLKKLREVDSRLTKEISTCSDDVEVISRDGSNMIISEFEEISRILDLKKKQLLKDLETWSTKKVKEHQVWRQMKDGHKKTVENFLKDCETIVDECDPERFLKVACDLNTRMKTQLDLMTMASRYEKVPNSRATEMNIKPVLDTISALQLTGDLNCFIDPFAEKNKDLNGIFTFKDTVKHWKEPKNAISDKYCELRQKYYESYCLVSTDPKTQALPKNESGKSLSNILATTMIMKGKKSNTFKVIRQAAFDEPNTLNPDKGLDLYLPASNMNCNENNFQKIESMVFSSENCFPLQDEAEHAQSTPNNSGKTQTQSGSLPTGVATPPTLNIGTSNTKISSANGASTAFCFTPCANYIPFSNTGAAFCFKGKSKDESSLPCFIFGKSDIESCSGNNLPGSTSAALNCPTSAALNCPTSCVAASVANPILSAIGKPTTSFMFGNLEQKHFTATKANDLLNVAPFSFVLNQPAKATEGNVLFQTSKKTTESAIRKSEDLIKLKLPTIEPCEQRTVSTVACILSKDTVKEEADVSKTLPFLATNIFSSSMGSSFKEHKSTHKFSFGHKTQNMSLPVTIAMNSQSKIKPSGIAQSAGKKLMIPTCMMPETYFSTYPFTSPIELTVGARTGDILVQDNSSSSSACNTLSVLFPAETKHFPSALSAAATSISLTREDDMDAKSCKTQGDLQLLSQKCELESLSHVSNAFAPMVCGDQRSGNSVAEVEVKDVFPADLDEASEETSPASSDASEVNDPNNEVKMSFKYAVRSINSSSMRE